MELCFVSPRAGNLFMRELLAVLAREAAALGAQVTESWDEFPPLSAAGAYVIVPHEYAACAPPDAHPSAAQLARTIALCVEQPGGPWWELSLSVAARAGAAMDINRAAMLEYPRRGIRAERFVLGHSAAWDRWGGIAGLPRPVDVLALSSITPRREQLFAAQAADLWPWRTRLVLTPEEPKPEPREDFVAGEDKLALLRSSRTLLNIHRSELHYYEWVRVLEAICNGCVVVSEHSLDVEPLVPGVHFMSAAADNVGAAAASLLRDEPARAAMAASAYQLVRDALPMRPSVEQMLALAESLSSGRRRGRSRGGLLAAAAPRSAPPTLAGPAYPPPVSDTSERIALKQLALNELVTRRRLEDVAARVQGLDPEAVSELWRTPAYERAVPQVSVCIPMYNHAAELVEALRALQRTDGCDWDAVVLDDGSTDGAAQRVRRHLEQRPWLPVRLLARSSNRGLGRTRNDLLAHARSPHVFVHDADNAVYPTTLRRLLGALVADPQALFSYSILQTHARGRPRGLLSPLPWQPERFRLGNYIDAMALVRRDAVIGLGGYSEEARLYGWEDFELWCKIAAAGGRGVHVPEILCRYRLGARSMLSITNIDSSAAWALLSERYPGLLDGQGADAAA